MTNAQEKKSFFAAINSGEGFVSCFEEIFFTDTVKRRYIIKGGPGTGKSSLMKRVAARAEEKGRTVEYYYCSSDTSSLDGIVIDGTLAVLDGTAPHSYDTVLPGAADEIINLGEHWNGELLVSHRGEISALAKKKSEAYKAAYGYLRAVGALMSTVDGIILPCIKHEKMRAAAARLLPRRMPAAKAAFAKRRQVRAFGTRGEVRLDTLEQMAKKATYISDYYGAAHLFIEMLCELAQWAGINVYFSSDTVNKSKLTELYFPDTGEYFGINGEVAHSDADTVNMKRFFDFERLSGVRCAYRGAMQAKRKLMSLAADSLALAGELHADIEKYYILAMRFDEFDGAVQKISEHI